MEREKSVLWRMVFDQLWRDGVTKQTMATELRMPLDEIESLIGELITQPPPKLKIEKPVLKIV